ncbi:DUF3068 domain-containing protein [Blastococcus montanus]|uniref:DUF3068 domain-containing protein n=1 Tax=Blastococcus montanus TaxID=3144973 RepID=UPI0032078DE6
MRGRAVGLGLLGLGAFLLVGAFMVGLVLAPTMVKLPLDQTAEPTAVGSDVSFFDLGEMRQLRGLDAEVQQRVQGDPTSEAAGEDIAVWNFGSVMTDSDGQLMNASTYRVCLDRTDAVAVACDVDQVDYDRDKDVEGLTLTFPFGTEQRDYDLFNPTTGQSFPARFEGVEEIQGLEVYKFVTTVPETVIRETDVPGALVGDPEAGTVPAEVVYSNQRTVWVEPTSGVVVTAKETPNTVLRGPDGTTGATILAGTFSGTDETVAAGVERAEETRGQITLIQRTLPLLMAGLGLVLLVVGVVLLLRGRTDRRRGAA